MTNVVADANSECWSLLMGALATPEGRRDSYPIFSELHKNGEAVIGEDGITYVFGYDAVSEVLNSRRFLYGAQNGGPPDYGDLVQEQLDKLRAETGNVAINLSQLDPPDHTRLRALVMPYFSPRNLRKFRIEATATIEHILAGIDCRAPIDLVSAIAQPFPAEVIGALVGLPLSRRREVATLISLQTAEYDPAVTFEGRLAAADAKRRHADYISDMIEERGEVYGDDLASILIRAYRESGALSEIELIGLLQILHIGGYETTTHMTGNAIVALLNNRSQLDYLKENVGQLSTAIRELLRYDTPIGLVATTAGPGAEFRGAATNQGDQYVCVLPAGNYDPSAFDAPSKLDLTRRGRPSLSFGSGTHYCLGFQLAMLELETILESLITRFPRMKLIGSPVRSDAFAFRRFESIPILLEP